MILNQAQAEAVYSAMCALNNVGGRSHVRINAARGGLIHVNELPDGAIQLWRGDAVGYPTGAIENYADQSAFAAAYGLDGKEPRTAR